MKIINLSKNKPHDVSVYIFNGKIDTDENGKIYNINPEIYMTKTTDNGKKKYRETVYYPNKFEGYEYDTEYVNLLFECKKKIDESREMSANVIKHDKVPYGISIVKYDTITKKLSIKVHYYCPETRINHNVILKDNKPIIKSETVYLSKNWVINKDYDIDVIINIKKEVIKETIIDEKCVLIRDVNSYELYDNEDKAEYRSRTDKTEYSKLNIYGNKRYMLIEVKFEFNNIEYTHELWMHHKERIINKANREEWLNGIYIKDWQTVYISRTGTITYEENRAGITSNAYIEIN